MHSSVYLVNVKTRQPYTCRVNSTSDTSIQCFDTAPSLTQHDAGEMFEVFVVTDNGESNHWSINFNYDGLYSQYGPSKNRIAGMDVAAFATVVSLVGLVAVLLVSLCALKYCFGVNPLSLCRCCRRCRDYQSCSSVIVPSASIALLESPHAFKIESPSSYKPKLSRFGRSHSSDSSSDPAASMSGAGY